MKRVVSKFPIKVFCALGGRSSWNSILLDVSWLVL